MALSAGCLPPPPPPPPSSAAAALRVRRPLRAVAVVLLAAGAAALALAAHPKCFLAARSAPPRGFRASRGAAGPAEKKQSGEPAGADEYDKYGWQKVAESSSQQARGGASAVVAADLDLSNLPELPDFADEEEPILTNTLAATTRVREVELPDLPGEDDQLVPPPPNPVTDGGLGLFEWTGVWIAFLIALLTIAGFGSYALGRVKIDREFAETAVLACRFFFGFFQVMFLARIAMTQFPKLPKEELPWALFYYPSEWILAPTRQVFPPEAGVDVAPVIWLMLDLLSAELLVGKDGILTMTANQSPVPLGFIR